MFRQLALITLFCAALSTVWARIENYRVLNANSVQLLTGTWSSGMGRVVTGLNFFDPKTRTFKAPSATGMAYSFSDDGYWEQALYRIIDNPRNPKCVQSQLIWQHGRYTMMGNGTLKLEPFVHEGCQLITSSCAGGNRTEEAYEIPEIYAAVDTWVTDLHGQTWQTLRFTDPWGNRSPPLYKRYDPPMMLPTEKLYIEVLGI